MGFISNLFSPGSGSGGSKVTNSTTTVTVPPPTEQEIALQKNAVQVADIQLGILKDVAAGFPDIFTQLEKSYTDYSSATKQVLNNQKDPTEALTELYNKQLSIAEGQGATDQEKATIKEAADRAIDYGTSDILRNERQSITQSQAQLKSRGLRTAGNERAGISPDSAILDRASQIVQESQRQVGQLSTSIRGAAAQTELEIPFKRAGLLAQQQGFQETQQGFQQNLRESLYNSYLKIFGAKVGLLGAPQTSTAALSVLQQPRLIGTTTSFSGTTSAGSSVADLLRGAGAAVGATKGLNFGSIFGGGGSGLQASSVPSNAFDAYI